jgi:hypothetical protein
VPRSAVIGAHAGRHSARLRVVASYFLADGRVWAMFACAILNAGGVYGVVLPVVIAMGSMGFVMPNYRLRRTPPKLESAA